MILTIDFSTEMVKMRGECKVIFEVLKENNCRLRILCSLKNLYLLNLKEK